MSGDWLLLETDRPVLLDSLDERIDPASDVEEDGLHHEEHDQYRSDWPQLAGTGLSQALASSNRAWHGRGVSPLEIPVRPIRTGERATFH